MTTDTDTQDTDTDQDQSPKGLREYADRKDAEASEAKAENERLRRELEWTKLGIDTGTDEAKELFEKGIAAETAARLLVKPASTEPEGPSAEEQAAHDQMNQATSQTPPPVATGNDKAVSDLAAAFNESGGMTAEQIEAHLINAGIETGVTLADGGQLKPWGQF